jgi:hypothetical protein
MPIFQATIQHDDKTFESLAHMQYDLFCKRNRISRTILSVAAILIGIVNSEAWWGILAIAYGCYLTTSTYSAANNTAHKLAKNIRETGMDFPSSSYRFEEEQMLILPVQEENSTEDPVPYSQFLKLGEDQNYFYLFPNPYGGYMISKTDVDEEAFRDFIRRKTGKEIFRRTAPVIKLMQKMKDRRTKPYRLQ